MRFEIDPGSRDAPTVRGPRFPWLALFAAVGLCALLGVVLVVRSMVNAHARGPASTSHLTLHPSPNVLVAIQDLSRLESVSFHMERVIELSDEQTHLWGLLDARDQILLVAAADVIAGVDLSTIRPQDIVTDWPHRAVHVTLPAPQLFSVVVDEEHTHVHSRSTDMLAERRADLESRARQEATRAMRDAALQRGILRRAQDNAEHAIRSLLAGLGYQQIVVDFRPAITTRE